MEEMIIADDLKPPGTQSDVLSRQPLWQVFDAAWYVTQYPDAAQQMQAEGHPDIETFYRERGSRLGHSPNMFFDETWYLSAYPDIVAHVAAGGARSGFDHYCQDGYRGRAPHWLFSEVFYMASNQDVTRGLLAQHGLVNGYDHYLTVGDGEFRSGHRFFDPSLYRQNDTSTDTGPGRFLPSFRRFLADGCRAGSTARLSWYFDPVWYLRTYPQVQDEIDQGWWTCALHHFLCNRTPLAFRGLEWFSEDEYGKTYPDVLEAVVDGTFRNTYEHFVRHGAAERRKPHPDIDLVKYYQSLRVQAELERGDFPDAFTHWVANRAAAQDQPAPEPALEAQSKALFVRQAENMLPQFARSKLDFTVSGLAAVSVIVVVHNKFALTMTALAALRACYAGGIQLILVDSGSRDETCRIGRYLTGARVIRFAHNAGFVEACNAGLDHADAPAVLYMNNDVTLGIKSLELALARLWSDDWIGAVGAKFIRTNGVLQEAGSIIWRDGSTVGYLRDADPNLPEANFVRDVDFCSGAFLLVRASILKTLGGFDNDYRPAYYEETDLCVRLKKAGYRIVYDPAVVVQHVEYGSASSARSTRMIQRNHQVFVDKHRDWLRYKYPARPRNALFARSPKPARSRILFIEDRIPLRDLGSGYVRSNDIIQVMAALGHQVGVYPIYPSVRSVVETLADFPETVEVLYDRGLDQLAAFIAERSGYYDIVWIGRTHNLERLLPILERCQLVTARAQLRSRHRGGERAAYRGAGTGARPAPGGRPRNAAPEGTGLRLFLPEDRCGERKRRIADPPRRAQQRRRPGPHEGRRTDSRRLGQARQPAVPRGVPRGIEPELRQPALVHRRGAAAAGRPAARGCPFHHRRLRRSPRRHVAVRPPPARRPARPGG